MRTLRSLSACALLALAACSDDSADPTDSGADTAADTPGDVVEDTEDAPDVDPPDGVADADDTTGDTDVADLSEDTDAADVAPDVPPPPVTDAARARGFQLYYRERVDRALVAYNRYGIFGDLGFAVAVDRASVARHGDDYDVVVGPKDNNLMGTPIRAIWHAWANLRSRNAELTLIRMFNGMRFFEQITGHPGVTARMVLPGWTLGVNGVDDTRTRTRAGAPVDSPLTVDAALEAEILDAFFDGVRFNYRMDPLDTMLTWYPGWDPVDYAITLSVPDLPDWIRISDCCATLMRTPEGRVWTDSWWSNHNSRDNYPDIALGLLAAAEAVAHPDTPESVRASAALVVEAGTRIADLVEDNDGNVVTVDEYNGYDTLVPSGEVRPHGLPENEGLGGMSSCPMALLNRALSSDGLDATPDNLLLPGTPELLITPDIEAILECPYDTPRTCASIADAWCGHTWESIFDLQVLGQSWLDLARTMESFEAGSSGDLLGAFQNDYDDVVEAMATLVGVLDVQGEAELAREARRTLGHMTRLQREFADIVYGLADPDRAAAQRYEAAIFDAIGGIAVIEEDLADFAIEEARMARLEGLLDYPDARPRTLYTDEELAQMITDGLAGLEDKSGPGRSDAIRARYAALYGDGPPPIRRAGDAYEARQGDGPWVAVERPEHVGVGSLDIMQGIVLCSTAPYIVDCSWARLGCEAADLDESGSVDGDDTALIEAAFDTHGDGAACGEDACAGGDIDASGTLDASDRAFMEAAQGCVR